MKPSGGIVHAVIPLRSQRTNRERTNHRAACLKKKRSVANADQGPQALGVEDHERLKVLHALAALDRAEVFDEAPGPITHTRKAYAIRIKHSINDARTGDSGNFRGPDDLGRIFQFAKRRRIVFDARGASP